MKQLILITLFSVCTGVLYGQVSNNSTQTKSRKISRSTVGLTGSSKTFKTEKGIFIVSHSVGQYSVIGTRKSNGYTIRQGFQQPKLRTVFLQPVEANSLSARVFPNPVSEKLFMSFDVTMKQNIIVLIYDISGALLFSNEFPPQQFMELNLSHLASGSYMIKVFSDKKQFVSNIIKH